MSSRQEARWQVEEKETQENGIILGTVCARPGTGTRSKKGGIASVTPSQKAIEPGFF